MVDIIAHIDKKISECLTGKSFGLCRQVIDDQGAVYPATYANAQGKYSKVTPDDKWNVIWFHRLMNSDLGDNEDLSFGRRVTKTNNTKVRTVLVSAFSENETPLDKMLDAMIGFMVPVRANIACLPDYKYIEFGESVSVSRTRDTVWTEEWGNAYKDKYQMRYNVYAIEFSIDYIKCLQCECA